MRTDVVETVVVGPVNEIANGISHGHPFAGSGPPVRRMGRLRVLPDRVPLHPYDKEPLPMLGCPVVGCVQFERARRIAEPTEPAHEFVVEADTVLLLRPQSRHVLQHERQGVQSFHHVGEIVDQEAPRVVVPAEPGEAMRLAWRSADDHMAGAVANGKGHGVPGRLQPDVALNDAHAMVVEGQRLAGVGRKIVGHNHLIACAPEPMAQPPGPREQLHDIWPTSAIPI